MPLFSLAAALLSGTDEPVMGGLVSGLGLGVEPIHPGLLRSLAFSLDLTSWEQHTAAGMYLRSASLKNA